MAELFTKDPKLIRRKLMTAKLSEGKRVVIDCIIDHTYGWGKDEDYIAYSRISEFTGLDKSHISKIVTALIKAKIVVRSYRSGNPYRGVNSYNCANGQQNTTKLSINKNLDEWEVECRSCTVVQQGVVPVSTTKERKNKEIKEQRVETISERKEDVKIIREYFYGKYKETFNSDYSPALIKDDAAIIKLLHNYSVDDVKKYIDDFLALDDEWLDKHGYSISLIQTKIQAINHMRSKGESNELVRW